MLYLQTDLHVLMSFASPRYALQVIALTRTDVSDRHLTGGGH